jgi:hypothetical protein
MPSSYWPTPENVRSCVSIEAERLPSAVLLAVHHPMRIEKRNERGKTLDGFFSEQDVVDSMVKIDRPIPIVGGAGSGKSHLIRWIEARLKTQSAQQDWHIVCIEKNLSLPGSLERLLTGLKGEQFDELRHNIKKVGETLTEEQIADHLLLFVAFQLKEAYREAQNQVDQIKQGQLTVSEDEKKRLKLLIRHAREDCLPALITDPNFKPLLASKGKCFHQIAHHLKRGSTNDEIEQETREVALEDLDFDSLNNLDDMSLKAREYARNSQISTDIDKKAEAVSLINEYLAPAQRDAFSAFFKIGESNFIDLFKEIRRSLKKEEKTLCVLIEDLRNITAIEDVLMDCLTQEAGELDNEELCRVYSAIAVTEGYRGYRDRRDTIATRAGGEWVVSNNFDQHEITSQITDFCGRYLNAARYGGPWLTTNPAAESDDGPWPPVWESENSDERETATLFGESVSGIPLFPFSESAIETLVHTYCTQDDRVEFNPRKVCQFILLNPLTDFYDSFQKRAFPPANFAGVRCPTDLQSELTDQLATAESIRAPVFAAIWGGLQCYSIANLRAKVDPAITREFGFEELSQLLEQTQPKKPTSNLPPLSKKPSPTNEPSISPPPTDSGRDSVASRVEKFFAKKNIPQDAAKEVRKDLMASISNATYLKSWIGLADWPDLGGSRPLVHIPYNSNNPRNPLFYFGSEEAFADQEKSLPYRQFITALLRHQEYGGTWDYPDGVRDSIRYENFVSWWILQLDLEKSMVAIQRASAEQDLKAALSRARIFAPSIEKMKAVERLNELANSPKNIRESQQKTGLGEWDNKLEEEIDHWKVTQDKWLKHYCATDRYGIEGDLVLKIVKKLEIDPIPAAINRSIKAAIEELKRRTPHVELVEDCTTKSDFDSLLAKWVQTLDQIHSQNQWKVPKGETVFRTARSKLKALVDDPDLWKNVRSRVMLNSETDSLEVRLNALHDIDLPSTQKLDEGIEIWRRYYDQNLSRLQSENKAQGADTLKDLQNKLDTLLRNLRGLSGVSEANLDE